MVSWSTAIISVTRPSHRIFGSEAGVERSCVVAPGQDPLVGAEEH